MKSNLIIFLTLIFIIYSLSCGGNENTYELNVENGVKIIENNAPLWGKAPKIKLELIIKFGDLDSEDDNYAFFGPFDYLKDKDGNQYVLDSGNHHVKKFDNNGTFITSIGRQGQGPGEISRAFSFNMDENEYLVIDDRGSLEFDYFTRDGKYLTSVKSFGRNLSQEHFSKLILLSSGEYVIQNLPDNNTEEFNSLLAILDSDGNIMRKIGKTDYSNSMNPRAYMIDMQIFINADREDNILVTYKSKNRIEKYSKEGELLFQTSRPVNYPVLEKFIVRDVVLANGMKVGLPVVTLVSTGIETDEKGRVWVSTFRNQPDAEFKGDALFAPDNKFDLHVFDSNGIFLTVLKIEHSFIKFKIYGDRLYVIDSFNEMAVFEYLIIDN